MFTLTQILVSALVGLVLSAIVTAVYMRWARMEFVESFTTGVMGLPVGVPVTCVRK